MQRIALFLLISLILTSCGKKSVEVHDAPRYQYEAGIIANCTSVSSAREIATELGGQFRVISSEKKLIEFIGIPEAALKEKLTSTSFYQNKIYENLVARENNSPWSEENIQAFVGPYDFPHLDQINARGLSVTGAGTIIAIVDTGVNLDHQDLKDNIIAGSNFVNTGYAPMDDMGHGTHVAGLAAGRVGGVAPRAKIMPIKVLNSNGQGDIGTIVKGILFAVTHNADVINLSLGGQMSNIAAQLITDAGKCAQKSDIILVSAAGNEGTNNDYTPIYPANLNLSNVISVASVDSSNYLSSFSNYGKNTIDIAAPGEGSYGQGLYSTWSNGYGYMSGTSMATPLVSGLVALIKSKNKNLTHTQIKDLIMNGGDTYSNLTGKIKSGKVINVGRTLSAF